METIDQDSLGVEPLVWWGSGEVVGNWVDISIRKFDEVYKWFVRVKDPAGWCDAKAGLSMTFDDAMDAVSSTTMELLLVWDEEDENDDALGS